MEKRFKQDTDFFKSTSIEDNGSLLRKAIPTVERKKAKVETSKKVTPKEVTAYKKKLEDAFKCIDDAVDDLQELAKKKTGYNYDKKQCAKMTGEYYEFKSYFQELINSAVNYPQQDAPMEKTTPSEYDKSRINI